MFNKKKQGMATIYKVEVVSHWRSYTKEQLQKLLETAIKNDKELNGKGNEVTVRVMERQ